MNTPVWPILLGVVLVIACQSRQSAADTVAVIQGSPTGLPQRSSPSKARADVGHACAQVATLMRARDAKILVVTDTLMDSTEYHPQQVACVVRADSFAVAPPADLLQTTPIDSGWSWHPFEGTGGETTYGITRDNVQCEVAPTIRSVGATSDLDFAQPAQRFHIFCYPD